MQTATLTIPAMHKESIALEVARALETVAGGDTVHITLAHARARVGFSGSVASPLDLRAAAAAEPERCNDYPMIERALGRSAHQLVGAMQRFGCSEDDELEAGGVRRVSRLRPRWPAPCPCPRRP